METAKNLSEIINEGMTAMSKQVKKRGKPKKYRPMPKHPPYKPRDLYETGALGKNKTYEGIKKDEIEHFTIGGVTFISPEWCNRVLGWPA
jgi:hypothetical protein